MQLIHLQGARIRPWLDALAALRIQVFREFPYLYDGSLDYERDYLETYARSDDSLCVLVLDEERAVGMSTALPLRDEDEAFMRPFIDQGFDVDTVCYFGESILLPEYRGQGLGVRFFEAREAHARTLAGVRHTAFCAVERLDHHPLRPGDHQPLDRFWQRRGYTPRPELYARYEWQDIDAASPDHKTLRFWLKTLE
ncbi:GNAT family N-acetyltransferase [Kushneria marisflavi]|uniref:GNAT family N-acetyltransferase n=1 Tax=Kushneria marisflavi TaxID=157779 RepID=A0A240UPI4_9GAMM|nr:GNAT family N-acetyltransferase [Kushneria marisflavi]ART62952.1 GNAT family N-acetyltransferase [Kushneria marisflavi]RKD84822.1 acetyltransferase (GNAT) family protein [Kushneria marisflavi]